MFIFPVQLTTSRIGNLTRLIHTLLYVMTIHTYIHTLGSKHTCDKNRRSSVTYASIISVFPPHPIPSSRTTKYAVCCCCLHIKESRSDLYSVPSNIRIGPTDANAFRGHRLTTQKGYTYAAYKTRNIFLKKNCWIVRDGSRSSDCAPDEILKEHF